jgi:hypothetical protein
LAVGLAAAYNKNMKTDDEWDSKINEIVKNVVEEHIKKNGTPFDRILKTLNEINDNLAKASTPKSSKYSDDLRKLGKNW